MQNGRRLLVCSKELEQDVILHFAFEILQFLFLRQPLKAFVLDQSRFGNDGISGLTARWSTRTGSGMALNSLTKATR